MMKVLEMIRRCQGIIRDIERLQSGVMPYLRDGDEWIGWAIAELLGQAQDAESTVEMLKGRDDED